MTSAPDRKVQIMGALEQAAAIRSARAAHKRRLADAPDLAAGRRLLAQLIQNPPPELKGMPVFDLLIAPRWHGRARVLQLLTTAKVSERWPIGQLTHRQRDALVAALIAASAVAAIHSNRRQTPKDEHRPPRTAKVFELRRDRNDMAYWHQVDTIDDCRHGGRPMTLLSIWIAETEPDPGSYRIEVSDGGWGETHYAVRAA